MKIPGDKMPTTFALFVLSWGLALFGVVAGGYVLFFSRGRAHAWITGLTLLLGMLFSSAVLRMLGVIGQILFDMKKYAMSEFRERLENYTLHLEAVNTNLWKLEGAVQEMNQTTNKHLAALHRDSMETVRAGNTALGKGQAALNTTLEKMIWEVKEISKEVLEKVACDTKDINQDIGQLRMFFEKIERHLDLRR